MKTKSLIKEKLLIKLVDHTTELRKLTLQIHNKVKWLKKNLPMNEDLKKNSKVVYDQHGEIFLYYEGIYYSFEIIKSIIEAHGNLTREHLYDSGI